MEIINIETKVQEEIRKERKS